MKAILVASAPLLAALVALAVSAAAALGPRSSPCLRLDQVHATICNGTGPRRAVSVLGVEREVVVYWSEGAGGGGGGGAARAAAALLAVAARHCLRYERVRLRRGLPPTLPWLHCTRTRPPTPLNNTHTHAMEVAIIPTVSWSEKTTGSCETEEGGASLGERASLQLEGAGAAPTGRRLRARLAPPARDILECRAARYWSFYTDDKALERCGFWDAAANTSRVDTDDVVFVYSPREWYKSAQKLVQAANATGARLRAVPLRPAAGARRDLLRLLRDPRRSFLFLDGDVWAGLPGVLDLADPPPPARPLSQSSVRTADVRTLRSYAPPLLRLFHSFKLTVEELRGVLELEADREDADVEQAACQWMLDNSTAELRTWAQKRTVPTYVIMVFLCTDDEDFKNYQSVLNMSKKFLPMSSHFKLKIKALQTTCSDEYSLMKGLNTDQNGRVSWARTVGYLVAGGAAGGARAAADAARLLDVPLVLADVVAPDVRLGPQALVSTGRLDRLAFAFRHFLSVCGWTRLAVLSDDTGLASALYESLRADASLSLLRVSIGPDASDALRAIRNEGARIVLVNAGHDAANSVLCAAHASGMVLEAGYVWILREWRSVDVMCADEPVPPERLSHMTISFWWRGGNVSVLERGGRGATVYADLADLWSAGVSWPPRAAALHDALQLLAHGFYNFYQKNSKRHYDLHGANSSRFFWHALGKIPEGATQDLILDSYALSTPLVFIHTWHGSRQTLEAVWRAEDGRVHVIYERRPFFGGAVPSDGSGSCLTLKSRGTSSPHCHDAALFTALVAATGCSLVLLVTRRLRRDRQARREYSIMVSLLSLGKRVSAALAGHLVDRAALELGRDLGEGGSGRVRQATLRTPGRPPLVVAAKSLREEASSAEENEFLTEACILASLSHERIVRFIGVCATGGPPLVLMEYAFFKDLHGYLSERRHLAERVAAAGGEGGEGGDCSEARHVSARALTALGRDAADALAYLARQQVVHRDVCARNCLVDSHRSLKLADFGMARKMEVGAAAGPAEYECRRRGMFPVRWMAPESLERGVFTAASDAWALGVLLLEVATLGARPYGDWPLPRVRRYVLAGGRPPLPDDVAPDMRRLVAQCWRREAGARLSAAEAAGWLRARPALLRPALAPLPARAPSPSCPPNSPDSPESSDGPSESE